MRWDEERWISPYTSWLGEAGDSAGRSTEKMLVHVDGDRRQIWFGGRTYTLHRIERQREKHSLLGQGEGSLRAEMPCQIVNILVAAGRLLRKGKPDTDGSDENGSQADGAESRRHREWLVEEGQVVKEGRNC